MFLLKTIIRIQLKLTILLIIIKLTFLIIIEIIELLTMYRHIINQLIHL